ncbi:hypothetical protein FNYG_16010 [Fusarium nygamai]|uniref:Uncharacterized protein n=1 Tax=Gibberella nygamai TaxID=42673 RepID=A0A2K0TV35_GIBNY|nr:hypothetical protein FNYG_16010 [Fusarium nygamai]
MGRVKTMALLRPEDDELKAAEAIGTLKAYSFNTEREKSSVLDNHEASVTGDEKLIGREERRMHVSTL